MTMHPPGWTKEPDLPRCRYGFKPGDIVKTPLGKEAKLVRLNSDEKWDAEYLDTYIHLASVVLHPATLKRAV